MLTESTENYLTAILKLQERNGAAATSLLAERLAVSRPSVTGMLKRLAADKLVEHRPYQGARLTRKGKRAALEVVRRHRLVETFLVHKLGMLPENVHEEAHRWEHVISPEVVDRLDDFLGRPAKDPHGSPIPPSSTRTRR